MNKKRFNFLDIAILTVFATLIIFTAIMIWLYKTTGGVPDTLIVSFFGTFGSELIMAAIIEVFKRKYSAQDRGGVENGSEEVFPKN